MGNIKRGRLTVALNGPWRLYNLTTPPGWIMLGTVQIDMQIGALARSPAGIYAQINAGSVWSLDQRKVVAALNA